jgi:hypothetical protein
MYQHHTHKHMLTGCTAFFVVHFSVPAGGEGCWCVAAGSVQGQEGEAPFLSRWTVPQGRSISNSAWLQTVAVEVPEQLPQPAQAVLPHRDMW